ncbi:MAG: hypothetical protein K1X51_03035 [Rhodospirillaceae bacterium]|nr:hypothetical protein [Rhodospirillaceae bacterium]
MKLTAHFEKFLEEEVNLNKSRIKTLVDKTNTISEFISNSDWGPKQLGFSAQGSWAHKTIIKPPGSAGYDADLLAYVSPVIGWTPKDYVLNLRRVFLASKTYEDKVSLGNRCVIISYPNDFSLDLVPCVVDRVARPSRFEVCNRTDEKFEPTNSEMFTRWLEQRNAWCGNNRLREVLRLLKYLRDVKTTFSCKSVLLTTLVAGTVTANDAMSPAFADPATSLKTLVNRLDQYLQARPRLHKVTNPVLPCEDFVRHWDDEKYENFRDMVHKYSGWIDDAFNDGVESSSITKWRRLFGDEFARGTDIAEAAISEATLPAITKSFTARDAVDAVITMGRAILAQVPRTLPWVKPAPFKIVTQQLAGVSIRATRYDRRDGNPLGAITSGSVVPKHTQILFEALASNGVPLIARDFVVQWRVVNTDRDALTAHALRGGFYSSHKPGRRWETAEYRGVHWIEAFVLRKRDNMCVGYSDRFFVIIE